MEAECEHLPPEFQALDEICLGGGWIFVLVPAAATFFIQSMIFWCKEWSKMLERVNRHGSPYWLYDLGQVAQCLQAQTPHLQSETDSGHFSLIGPL